MASICIDMLRGKSPLYRAALRETIYETLRDVVGVAAEDRHEMITEYEHNDLNIVANLIGGTPSSDAILVQLTFNEGCTLGKKQVLYDALVQMLQQRMGLRPEDVAIVLDVRKGDCSFGNVSAHTSAPSRHEANSAASDAAQPLLRSGSEAASFRPRFAASAGALFEYRRTRSARMLCGPGED